MPLRKLANIGLLASLSAMGLGVLLFLLTRVGGDFQFASIGIPAVISSLGLIVLGVAGVAFSMGLKAIDQAMATLPRTTTNSGPPPGWYPDPDGQPRGRYWNGTQWTDQYTATDEALDTSQES